jgi:hypothetical protein
LILRILIDVVDVTIRFAYCYTENITLPALGVYAVDLPMAVFVQFLQAYRHPDLETRCSCRRMVPPTKYPMLTEMAAPTSLSFFELRSRHHIPVHQTSHAFSNVTLPRKRPLSLTASMRC